MTFQPANTYEPPLPENVSFSEDYLQFLEQITRYYRDIARKVNDKDRGYYVDQEIINDQKWFDATNRQRYHWIFRNVINTGTLPNAATTTIAHGIAGITNAWQFTRIYGWAQDPTVPRWIPIPNGGTVYPIGVWVDNTNVYLESAVNLAAFTVSYIILEYWKI